MLAVRAYEFRPLRQKCVSVSRNDFVSLTALRLASRGESMKRPREARSLLRQESSICTQCHLCLVAPASFICTAMVFLSEIQSSSLPST